VTTDPSQVSDDFINSGYDVLVSGLDTTEALVQTEKAAGEGKQAWAVAYEDTGACSQAPEVCLGVPTFNWIPSYVSIINDVRSGSFQQSWEWVGPDWEDINNQETSWIGFTKGGALTPEAAADLDEFIAELAGGLNLWTGPLNYQDGTPFLADGEIATDQQIWYNPTLLEGVEGQSVQ
jgi:simple sugar transport system substrate-binding protein